jgi:hypothetical protein
LIRNVITEVGMFTFNGIQPGITLVTESLVLLGLCSLLLVVEPLGALIVVSVLGAAAWGFHRLTGGLDTRLAEEIQRRPKPMGEIGGRPILWHIIKFYSAHGFQECITYLGDKGYMIKE